MRKRTHTLGPSSTRVVVIRAHEEEADALDAPDALTRRVSMLLAALVRLVSGDVQLVKVISSDFEDGCMEVVIRFSDAIPVPPGFVTITVREWEREGSPNVAH